MGEWQPIETAPRDGTPLFATCQEHCHMGIVIFDGREWEALDFQGLRTGTGFYPSHWMFLPEPPE